MAELTKEEKIQIIKDNIENIKDKNFKVFFYVLDTKGNPSGSLEYIYQTAYTLKSLGYNVIMVYQEDEFVGVGEWLGQKYADLPHQNIKNVNIEAAPSDFLFIPEIFADVMIQYKKYPFKKVVLVQNYNYMEEAMPLGASFNNLKIYDLITTTETQAKILREYFPEMNVSVVSPSIGKIFRDTDKPRKLIVNVISRNQSNIKRIMKAFRWKYPVYGWVSFRELRGLTQEELSDALREGAITIWFDEDSNFGYTALEAMRCGSILLAKIPNTLSDWNLDENGKDLTDACIWFDNINLVPDMLASVVRTWTLDNIPEEVYTNLHKLDNKYTPELQENEIKYVYEKIFENRQKDFEEVLAQLKNKE